MRKYNTVKIIVCLIFIAAFFNVALSTDTNAASCKSFVDGTTVWDDGTTLADRNPSLYNACRWNNGGNSVYGALWLNDNPAWSAISSTVKIGRNERSKSIYLHGVVIGTSGNSAATFIKITRGNKYMAEHNCEDVGCRIEYNNNDEWAHPSDYSGYKDLYEYHSYDAIGGWGGDYTVNRPGFYYSSTIDDTGTRGLTLDVEALKKKELGNGTFSNKNYYGGSVTYGNGVDTYKIPFQIFRCNSSSGDSVIPGLCYSDTSWVTIETPPSRYAGAAMAVDTTNNSLDWTKREQNGGWAAYTKLWPEANEGDQKTYYDIGDCPPDSGCDFGFRFFLKAYNYGPTTKFRIFETDSESNLKKTVKKSWDAEPKYFDLTDGNGGPDYSGKQVYSFTGNVKPGQIKCGTIEYDTSDDHSANSSTRLATVCVRANAQQPGFQGRSNVWDEDHTTGWFGAGNKTETYYINDCATTGCDVALSHYLKRSSGSGTTQYDDVTKERNGWSREPKKSEYDEEGVTDSSLSRDNGALIVRDTYTLYPGEKICETLNFSSKGDGNKDGHSTVCAVALGETGSDIDMKVMNSSLVGRNFGSQYAQYNDETFIKPGDSVNFRATYSALSSYVADLRPDAIKIDSGGSNNNPGGSRSIRELFNDSVNPDWQKGFVAFGSDDNGIGYDWFIGDGVRTKMVETNGFKAGTTYVRTAKTNPRDVKNNNVVYNNVWTTPESATFSNDAGNLVVDVSTGTKSDDAYVKVPYNFNNSICILKDVGNDCQDNGSGLVVYAGESTSVRYKVSVGEKKNAMLADTYATNVDHAKIRVFVCYSGQCGEVNSARRDDVSFVKGDSVGTADSVQIPDLPAGTDVTIRTMVYPKQSYKDDAMGESDWGNACRASIDECWEISSVTYKVAKKPSFQVWGGSLSAKSISALVAEKMNLGGYSFDKAAVFGSWAELAVVTNIKKDDGTENTTNKKAMASGAGLGYDSQINGKLWPDPSPSEDEGLGNNPKKADASSYEKPGGGMRNIDYTNLTFNGGGGVIVPKLAEVKSALGINETAVEEGHTLSRREDITETTLFYDTNTIEITGEIMVKGGTYSSLESVPKVVIYSDGGINIECNVRRIDAILIANGDINTCSNPGSEGNIKKAANAQEQLTINGAIIVGKKSSDENGERTLLLNRTYGAATGNNSIVPAEIINYDNSMMFIGGGSASASASVDPSKLEVQHIRELAPRY